MQYCRINPNLGSIFGIRQIFGLISGNSGGFPRGSDKIPAGQVRAREVGCRGLKPDSSSRAMRNSRSSSALYKVPPKPVTRVVVITVTKRANFTAKHELIGISSVRP